MLWGVRAYEQRISVGWKLLSAAVRAHRAALALLGASCVVGQFVALSTGPLVVTLPDTSTYLAVTHQILTNLQFFDAWRTPGYPAFMALIFVLTGGQNLDAVAIAQVCLMVLTTFEIYVLCVRITHARWQACLIAALCALNPFYIAFEHTITTETLTYWLIVTLFLVFEDYLRRGHVVALSGIALLLVATILTRPQFVFLPLLLALMLAIWRWRSGALRGLWREVGIAGVLPCLLILAYCAGNAAATNYFGLSDVANVSLFGKVIEYHMFDETGPGSDANTVRFRNAVHAAEATWDQSPAGQDSWHVQGNVWTFVDSHPEFESRGRAIYGAYSIAIIEHHPLEYLQKSLSDVVAAGYASPVYFAAPGYATPYNLGFTLLFVFLARLYAFLPLIVVFAAWSFWRHGRDVAAFSLLVLMLTLSATIVVGAFTDFAEFWRIRFPVDWIMMLAFVVTLVASVRGLARWLANMRGRRAQGVHSEVTQPGERSSA